MSSDSVWPDGEVHYSFDYNALLLAGMNYIFTSNVLHRIDKARLVGGFDSSLHANEDWDLWLRMSRHCLLRHVPEVTCRYGWQGDNISARDTWQTWQKVYKAHQHRLAEEGITDRHHDLPVQKGPKERFDPTTWTKERRQLVWYAPTLLSTSYGITAKELFLAIERQGIEVSFAPIGSQLPAELAHQAQLFGVWNRLTFLLDYRSGISRLPSERVIWCTMHESTEVPQMRVREINQIAELLYLPIRQNIEAFESCGVKVPIKLLHLGVNTVRFPYLERRPKDVFTFGTYGVLTRRKGVDVLIRAFSDEFADTKDVRLILKTTRFSELTRVDDPRVTVVDGFLSQQALVELLQRMDVFVLPSRAEGFGLCGLEAMSTGLPIIATDWSGPSEYLNPHDSYPLNYRLVEIDGIELHGGRYYGQWAEPDYEHLRYLMRYLYEHRQEAREKGRLASERIHKEWTWSRVARQLRDDLDELAGIRTLGESNYLQSSSA